MKLTDLTIRRTSIEAKAYTLCDGAGLYLNIKSNGTKQWLYRFYWEGIQKRISLGLYPTVDLKKARSLRQQAQDTGISIPVLILLLGLLLPFEGKHNKAYVDPVGVVTICIGHTATAKAGQYKTDAQCYQLLASDLQDSTNAINNYVKVPLSNQA